MPTSEPATVVFNPSAGGADATSPDDIREALAEQGYRAACHRTESEHELDGLLADLEGLVVVCGGDGTMSAVLRRLAGRTGLEVALVPLGTANNIAHALELPSRPLDALADLASRPRRTMDLGRVSFAGQTATFVEGFGCGVYAEMLHTYEPDQGKSVGRALEAVLDVMGSFEPVHVRATVDGRDVSDRYLLFAVLNTKRIGPRLELAADADPCDGALDVVGLRSDAGPAMFEYLQALTSGEIGEPDGGVHWHARRVQIARDAFTFHLDTVTYDLDARAESADPRSDMLDVDILPHHVTVITGSS